MEYMVNHVFMVNKPEEIHGELCGEEMMCQTPRFHLTANLLNWIELRPMCSTYLNLH